MENVAVPRFNMGARALYEDIASRLPAHSMISSTGYRWSAGWVPSWMLLRIIGGIIEDILHEYHSTIIKGNIIGKSNRWIRHEYHRGYRSILYPISRPNWTIPKTTRPRWPGKTSSVLLQGAEVELRVEHWMRCAQAPGQRAPLKVASFIGKSTKRWWWAQEISYTQNNPYAQLLERNPYT